MTGLFRMVAGSPMSAAVLSVVLFAAAPAHASTIYTYTGNLFSNTSLDGPTAPADLYTTADRITGFIELADPLAPNLGSLTTLTPLTFSFSDGVNTITDVASSSSFQVTTDAAGNIVNWRVAINFLAPTSGNWPWKTIGVFNSSSGVFDLGRDTLCGNGSTTNGCDKFGDPYYEQTGSNGNSPGTWRLQTASVPEPTSTLLLGTALLGFALRRRHA